MKKVRLMKLALIGLLMGMTQSAHAFDWSGDTYGNAPTAVSVSGGKATDATTFYLYNVAQKKFLNAGGWWGTECVLSDTPMPVYLYKNGSNYYLMLLPTNTTASIGRAYGAANEYQNGIFTDAATSGQKNYSEWRFALASGKTNQYTLQCRSSNATGGYLTISTSRTNVVSYTTSIDDNSYWKLISLKDAKDRFTDVQDVDYDNPIDATFYLSNPSMTRASVEAGNIVWTVGSGSWVTNKTTGSDLTYFLGNDLYYNTTVSHYALQSDATNTDIGSLDGDKYTIKDTDAAFIKGSGLKTGDKKWYNLIYGQYFNARIKGNGTVSQTITVDKAGWYEVECQGFNSEGNANALLYANVSGTTDAISNMSNTIQKLPIDSVYTMSTAGYAFSKGWYPNVVLVFVPNDNSTVTIGVKVSGAASGEYTEFDEFRLKYRGLKEYPILLDETKENTDYIVFPAEGKTATVVLKRTFSTAAGSQWNSIVLPFDLTGAQVKNYFGRNVKLAELEELTSSKIWYKSVDLSTDGMKAGTPYIIKCDRTLAQYTKGAITVAGKDVNTAGETLAADAEYIVIPQVALEKDKDGALPLGTDVAANDNAEIKACGLYVKQDITLADNHHYYAYAQGILYHYSNQLPADKPRTTLPMKGFRVYFDWTENQASEAKLSCYLDGVEEQTIITAIEGVTTGDASTPANGRKGIFTLDGQQVRGTGDSVEGLQKGVYIVNGKKLVVK
ncbi:MAG: hypothetical protein ACI3YX_01350 [Prevotella sp.]